jgi:hypothetical protein
VVWSLTNSMITVTGQVQGLDVRETITLHGGGAETSSTRLLDTGT